MDMSHISKGMNRNLRAILGVYFLELFIWKIVHASGNIEMRTVPQVFRVVLFEMGIRNDTKHKICDYCSSKCIILVSRNTGRKSKVQLCWLLSLRKTFSINQRYTGKNLSGMWTKNFKTICYYCQKNVTRNNTRWSLTPSCQGIFQ